MTLVDKAREAYAAKVAADAAAARDAEGNLAAAAIAALQAVTQDPVAKANTVTPDELEVQDVRLPDGPVILAAPGATFALTRDDRKAWAARLVTRRPDGRVQDGPAVSSLVELGEALTRG